MFATCGEYHEKLSALAEKERLARESEDKQKAQQAKKELLDACKNGNAELVKELLEKKVNIDCYYGSYVDYSEPGSETWKQEYLGDPIHLAIKGDHPDILRMLLKYAVPEIKEKITLALFPFLTDDKVLSQLVNIIDNQNRNNAYPLKNFYYLPANSSTYLGFIDARHQPLLIEAILLNSIKCVEMLTNEFSAHPFVPFYKVKQEEYGPCTYEQGTSAVEFAANLGLSEITLFLLRHGFFRIEFLNSLLFPAVKNNDEELVKYLLNQDIDIYAHHDEDGQYAVDLAKGNIKALLQAYKRETNSDEAVDTNRYKLRS